MSLVPFGPVLTESNRPVAPPACPAAVRRASTPPRYSQKKRDARRMPPLISDRTARNGLSVRPVRTGRPTRAVDLQSNDQSRPPWKPSGSPSRKLPEAPSRKTPPLEQTLPEDPFATSFEDTLSGTF